MKWSLKLGEVAGIAVYVHATFVLLIIWVATSYWVESHSLQAVVTGVVFILALFGCVLLHELGHALTAKRYGIKTRDITLLPIGGLARLERMPDDPKQELWVALAGPAVNVVIAAALLAWLAMTGDLQPIDGLGVTSGSLVERLMVVNIGLVLFNMLPAFPMDGGRVLRALLATRMEYTRATRVAASLGQAMALFFGFIGLFANPMLLFVALFVWIGAAQEAGIVEMTTALSGIPVASAMITDFHALEAGDTLAEAVAMILSGSQQDFPVLEDGRILGILTRDDLMRALGERGQSTPVTEVMQRDFQVADASETLQTAFSRLKDCACHTLPVMRGGRVAGLITMDNLGEFLMIQSALSGSRSGALGRRRHA